MHWLGMKPNAHTFISVLSSCASLATLEQGKHILNMASRACIIKIGFYLEVSVGNTLLTMFAKCGKFEDSHMVHGMQNLKFLKMIRQMCNVSNKIYIDFK